MGNIGENGTVLILSLLLMIQYFEVTQAKGKLSLVIQVANGQCQREYCHLAFRMCVADMNVRITESVPPLCFKTKAISHWGLMNTRYSKQELFNIDIDYPWPGKFGLIIDAFNVDKNFDERKLTNVPITHKNWIARFVHRGILVPGEQSHMIQSSSSSGRPLNIEYTVRMQCTPNYYNTSCTKLCKSGSKQYKCSGNGDRICFDGWMGKNCATPICKAGCHSVHGYCTNPNECDCRDGWKGAYCNECIPYPGCKQGTCHNSPWTCTCYPNWGGPFCDIDLDYCGRHKPCENKAICKNMEHGSSELYKCICPSGFKGKNCEIKLPVCSTNPCKNGRCIERSESEYECRCIVGYQGINCDKMVDLCNDEDCQNGAKCKTIKGRKVQCECQPGYYGKHCHLKSACKDSKCVHATHCSAYSDRNNHQCMCKPGWTGPYCDQNIDDCRGKCQNNGTCYDLINDYFCQCRKGFSGRNCSINEACASNPCLNKGWCTNIGKNNFKCECPEGYKGKQCEISDVGCEPNPCRNGAFCFQMKNQSYCKCVGDHWGKYCEHLTPYCGLDNPHCSKREDVCSKAMVPQNSKLKLDRVCGEHGTCVAAEEEGQYRCVCQPGFVGERCETNINDCQLNLCQNGGVCLDHIQDYECLCPDGFTGKRCEHKVNPCLTNPCKHGQCYDRNNELICECFNGYRGKWCETTGSNNPCNNATCLNGGKCLQDSYSDRGFRCECPHAWQGTYCQIRNKDYQECNKLPCQNGGTCIDFLGSYSCVCKPGYEGQNCDIQINKCQERPCFNNGTCVKLANSYKCECKAGFFGPECQINRDDCREYPCAYGATCIDLVNDYKCICPYGRHGKNCEEVSGLQGKYPSCDFEGRIYDHGKNWTHNCRKCRCYKGEVKCQADYCGEYSCHQSRTPNDPFACKPGTQCMAIDDPGEPCFVRPCFVRHKCIRLTEDINKYKGKNWPSMNSLSDCQPNKANPGNYCALLRLTYHLQYVPYGTTVTRICEAVKSLGAVQNYKKSLPNDLGISCAIERGKPTNIMIAISCQRSALGPSPTSRGRKEQPLVHKIVNQIANDLTKSGNNSAVNGLHNIQVNTQIEDENAKNSQHLTYIILGLIVLIGIIAIGAVIFHHEKQKKHLYAKYAQPTKVNNKRDISGKSAFDSNTNKEPVMQQSHTQRGGEAKHYGVNIVADRAGRGPYAAIPSYAGDPIIGEPNRTRGKNNNLIGPAGNNFMRPAVDV